MHFFTRFQWVFMIIAIFIGLALSQSSAIAERASLFITPFLMIMLFGVFMQIPFKSLKAGFANVKLTALSLAVNFVWTPLLAFGLSYLFFRNAPDVFVALIMDLVTPCTDWYLVFTGIAGGHLAFSIALLPWNLLLQLVLMPVYLFIFAGAVVEIQPLIFLESFFRVLLAPFVVAVIARNILIKYRGEGWFQHQVMARLDFFQALFLTLAIAAMFASQGMILLDNLDLVVKLILPVFLFFLINFILGRLIGRVFKLSYRESASLIITTLARNAPLAIVIAVAVFPGRPLIPLVLAVESLIELPLLYVFARLLIYLYYRDQKIKRERISI